MVVTQIDAQMHVEILPLMIQPREDKGEHATTYTKYCSYVVNQLRHAVVAEFQQRCYINPGV